MPGLDRRRLSLGLLAASGLTGIAGAQERSGGQMMTRSAAEERLSGIDPELVEAVRNLADEDVSAANLETVRARPTPGPLPPPAPQLQTVMIPGPPGAPEVMVQLIDPPGGGEGRSAFLHMHGGGFVAGKAGRNPSFLQTVAAELGCVVASVGYRLAPETPFPGSLEDNYAALAWLNREAGRLRIDPSRIMIGGESAGGGHAAMLAIAARDRGDYPIAFQLLTYPMLDDRTGATRPAPAHTGRVRWSAASNRFGWGALLGRPPGGEDTPPGASPARVKDLSGLPPAFIGVGGLDLFLEEDIEYARRLTAAGVACELLVIPGAYHGFDVMVPDAGPSRRFREARLAALTRAVKGSA
jgi:acetyl esterase/lipase